MAIDSILLPVHQLSVKHRSTIESLFFWFEIMLVGLWIVGSLVVFANPKNAFSLYEVGTNFGVLSLGFYFLTLIPGILTRLKILPLMGVLLQTYRRHFGISMFLNAFIHMSLTTTMPALANNRIPAIVGTPAVWGFIALLLLLPLWLTSNDFAQKRLGKKWKLLHRLTYLALIFIFLHQIFFNHLWMIPVGGMLGLELASWVIYWRRQTAIAQTAAQG